jgi:uncharacterized protein YdeI (YjbR/CyaY-like superfamily)
MSKMNPKVDGYIRKNKRWGEELARLRSIVLACPLTEEIKWRVPCYTFGGSNVILFGAFKEYCGISFIKGALLKDTRGILKPPGENTQSARLIRFTQVREIVEMESTLKAYIHEAIAVEKAGGKVKFKKITEFKRPAELQKELDAYPALQSAFAALTPGRQRAYLMYFSGAKQSKTREARVAKCVPLILQGKGLDDDYRR